MCESKTLGGLIGFALGRYTGVAIRTATDFESASAAMLHRTPGVTIIDAEMPEAPHVAHLSAPGTRIVAVNGDSGGVPWAHAVVPAPFQPSRLQDALETLLV